MQSRIHYLRSALHKHHTGYLLRLFAHALVRDALSDCYLIRVVWMTVIEGK
jgi:predicted transcriptional regulator